MAPALADRELRTRVLALRLAVLFHHARRPIEHPRIAIGVNARIRVGVPARWQKAHPLTAHLLARERSEWEALGYRWAATA